MADQSPYSLDINIVDRDPFAVFRLEGSIASATVYELKHEFHRLIEYEKRTNVVLDLSGVEYIDSGGIGAIVYANQCCKQVGGRLVAVNPVTQHALTTLQQVSLTRIISFYDDLMAAVVGSCESQGIRPPDSLITELGGEAGPSLEQRVGALEDRLAQIDAMLEQLLQRKAG